MNPLERYLNAVRGRLPRKGRDDVMAELRGALLDRLERREAELGRPLTTDEQRSVVRGFGHPWMVAAGYWNGWSIFGGPLSLFYRQTLLWGVVTAAFVQCAIAIAGVIQGGTPSVAVQALIPHLVSALLTVFTVTTLVFLALDAGRTYVRRHG